MTDGTDENARPPRFPKLGFRRLRLIALVVAILASFAIFINNGLGIWSRFAGQGASAKEAVE